MSELHYTSVVIEAGENIDVRQSLQKYLTQHSPEWRNGGVNVHTDAEVAAFPCHKDTDKTVLAKLVEIVENNTVVTTVTLVTAFSLTVPTAVFILDIAAPMGYDSGIDCEGWEFDDNYLALLEIRDGTIKQLVRDKKTGRAIA